MASHVTIELQRQGESEWRFFGNFCPDSDEQAEQLRVLLEGRDPFDVMDQIQSELIWDVLDILRLEGCTARVLFHADQ